MSEQIRQRILVLTQQIKEQLSHAAVPPNSAAVMADFTQQIETFEENLMAVETFNEVEGG